jgi:putative ABC transport system permease protein
MRHLLRDIRYAARSLMRAPGFTLGVVLTLALGIGANATMFGVVDTLFLRPPAGVREPGRVARVYLKRTVGMLGTFTGQTTTFPTFTDLRDAGVFERTATVKAAPMSLGRGASARQVNAMAVSHDYFPLLGVSPGFGRFFGADEDRPGAPPVAVLAHGFWRRHFAGDSSVIGRTLPLGHGTYTVIGVAPAGFGGIELSPPDLWVPIQASVAIGDMVPAEALTSRGWIWNQVMVRLKPGARVEDAAALATTAYRRGAVPESRGDSNAVVMLGPVQAARGPEVSSDSKVSAWIGLVALIVLLIACANVANLLLARGVSRRRELAVRAGLGAGRGGLVRMLLAESLVFAALGGGAALLLAMWGGSAVRGLLIPDLPADLSIVDGRVLAFAAAAVLLTALLTGLAPAIQSSRTDLADALKSGGHGATARGGRTRAALLVAQIALTLVLLVGAGLFVRSLRNVQRIDLGFDADQVLEASVDMGSAHFASTADANAAYLRILAALQRMPGVASASPTMSPFGWAFGRSIRAEGVDSMPHTRTGGPYINAVGSDYFGTMGMPLMQGRGLTAADVPGAALVAVVSASMARLVWPGQSALGKCLFLGDDAKPCTRVVGIVGDAKRGDVLEDAQLLYYVPLAQVDSGADRGEVHALVVRSRTRAADIADAVRREMQAAGNLPYADVHSLAERIAPQYRSWQLGAAAFTAFGALALVIAAMGIFAVISYSVSQRTHEIGIRMALGAETRRVARMILAQGLRAAIAGVAIGAVGAYAMARGLASLLYGVPAGDPLVFSGVAAALVLVAAAAAWLPARRAARIEPMIALRSE